MHTLSIAGSEVTKSSYCPNRYIKRMARDTFLKRTFGSVPLVSLLKKFDCTRFATTPFRFTLSDFHQHIPDYKGDQGL